MALRLIKKFTILKSLITSPCLQRNHGFLCIPARFLLVQNKGYTSHTSNDIFNLSPLCPDGRKIDMKNCKIELVDNETWNVSSGLAETWRGDNNNANVERTSGRKLLLSEDEEVADYLPPNKEDPDFDEVEDMRIRGNLFYKIDKHSKEYEEHKFDFHRRNSSANRNDKKEGKAKQKENARSVLASDVEKAPKHKDGKKETKKNSSSSVSFLGGENKKDILVSQAHAVNLGEERIASADKNSYLILGLHGLEVYDSKKKRTLTFNQVTAPYHEPFCLDIYVSKGSARASVIHRATSKVVAVAHSISKDLKYDLGSPKSRSACALVGKVLAQRALDDDIHNVVYTPRKGEKLEGKLQIVLQAIIDGGVEVKVKLKQRKVKRTSTLYPRARHQY